MSTAPPSTRSPSPSINPTLPTAPANLSSSLGHPRWHHLKPRRSNQRRHRLIHTSSVVYDYSVAVAGSNATISFTGDSAAELSTAEAEALLDALQYNNSSNNPTASSDRVLSINAFDGDAQTSNTATSTITVAAANDAPTLDLDTTDSGTTNYAFTFTEGIQPPQSSPQPLTPH